MARSNCSQTPLCVRFKVARARRKPRSGRFVRLIRGLVSARGVSRFCLVSSCDSCAIRNTCAVCSRSPDGAREVFPMPPASYVHTDAASSASSAKGGEERGSGKEGNSAHEVFFLRVFIASRARARELNPLLANQKYTSLPRGCLLGWGGKGERRREGKGVRNIRRPRACFLSVITT